MKRVLSFIFAMVMLLSCAVFIVSAQEDVLVSNLQESFDAYCTKAHGAEMIGKIHCYAECEGVVYFRGNGDFPEAAKSIGEKVGDWYIYSTQITAPDGIGLYVYKDGVIYNAKTAYENGVISDLTPFSQVTKEYAVYLWKAGDANGDGIINIKDATTVQKVVAGISAETVLYEQVMNINGDNVVNIKDATAIQKKIADI